LGEDKNYSLQELSIIFEIDILTIKAQLEYLEQQGYIKKVERQTSCSKNCRGCKGCSQQVSLPVMWERIK
jgi:DNA-binding transcriptional regulator YhcF (GntR family)